MWRARLCRTCESAPCLAEVQRRKKAEENAKFLQRQIEEKKATELGKFGAAGMNEIEFALNAKKVTAREV